MFKISLRNLSIKLKLFIFFITLFLFDNKINCMSTEQLKSLVFTDSQGNQLRGSDLLKGGLGFFSKNQAEQAGWGFSPSSIFALNELVLVPRGSGNYNYAVIVGEKNELGEYPVEDLVIEKKGRAHELGKGPQRSFGKIFAEKKERIEKDPDFALFTAVEENDVKRAQEAIDRGANVNALFNKRTPLIESVSKNNPALVRLLLKQSNILVDAVDEYGRSALHRAIDDRADISIIWMLLFDLANPNHERTKDNDRNTPLFAAVAAAYPEAVIALLARRANANHINRFGRTPLLYTALFYNNVPDAMGKIALILLEAGADPCHRDNYGDFHSNPNYGNSFCSLKKDKPELEKAYKVFVKEQNDSKSFIETLINPDPTKIATAYVPFDPCWACGLG